MRREKIFSTYVFNNTRQLMFWMNDACQKLSVAPHLGQAVSSPGNDRRWHLMLCVIHYLPLHCTALHATLATALYCTYICHSTALHTLLATALHALLVTALHCTHYLPLLCKHYLPQHFTSPNACHSTALQRIIVVTCNVLHRCAQNASHPCNMSLCII